MIATNPSTTITYATKGTLLSDCKKIVKPGNNHNYCNTTMREPTTEIISRWYPVEP